MSLTKRKLTECLYDQCGFRMREAGEVVDSVFEMMKSRLEAGEEIMISGFGKLEVREKPAKTGDIMWTNHWFRGLCGMLTQGRCLMKQATCHTFQHPFAIPLLGAGYDIRTVQELLGHNDFKTTMIYTHGPGCEPGRRGRQKSRGRPVRAACYAETIYTFG